MYITVVIFNSSAYSCDFLWQIIAGSNIQYVPPRYCFVNHCPFLLLPIFPLCCSNRGLEKLGAWILGASKSTPWLLLRTLNLWRIRSGKICSYHRTSLAWSEHI